MLAANEYTALVPIEPGGGKTALATLAIKNSGAQVALIIAPKNTIRNAWEPTVKAVLGQEARVIGKDRKAHREAESDLQWGVPGVYITTHQYFTRADVSQWYGDLAVVDEGHRLGAAGKKGQRKLSGYTAKDPEPLSQRFPMRLVMSGTPFRHSFERAWGLMRFLWPELDRPGQIADRDHYRWKLKRMTQKKISVFDPRIKKRKTVTQFLDERNPGELISQAPCVVQHFRRRRCCVHHPQGFLQHDEPNVIEREVELSATQKKSINQLKKHYMTWLGGNPLVTELDITKRIRIRQFVLGVPTLTPREDDPDEVDVTFDVNCESPMLDEVLDILETLDEGEPVLVLLESQKFAEVATQRLNEAGYSAFEFSGQTTKDRDAHLATFGQPGGHQVCVGVLAAIGEGTDGLQKVCNTEIWLQRADATTNLQSEARTDRMGCKGQTQRFILFDSEGVNSGEWESEALKRTSIQASTTRVS